MWVIFDAYKHFKNFEVISFFAYIYNENAGTEGFPQLYKGTHDAPVAVYDSSEAVLNALFPKDKTIMLMCQSGGRVAMLMKMLAANGYDMSKIYNIGGMAQYTGEQYREFLTDTEELNVEDKYIINAQ
ncbi:MAG: rhodanese-like domain-containing protein [Tissierellia bacterium]|nr:rhodanese-like domain-containing protein [Tissierellia bacterium]